MKFEIALAKVLDHEGGFVDDTRDPGGMTCLGVTRSVWQEWVGHPVTEREMRALTPDKVAPLYKRKYWDRVKADQLPDGLDYSVFDFAVNSGPGRAIKLLQSCVDVKIDGDIGPVTIAAVNAANPRKLVFLYNDARLAFLKSLPHWDVYKNGWSKRVASVTQDAIAVA